jgi:membrane-bound lytic murein transglycosylase D
MIVVRCLAALTLATLSGPTGSGSGPISGATACVTSEFAAGRPSWDIPITFNKAVDRWLVYYQTRGRRNFQIHLARAGRYEPTLRAILREHGLPEDLVYLSLIESGYDPNAYSSAHAVGLWQFLTSTGRRYGLRVSYWIDERRDPILATRAAAAHLRDLYEEFGSWYLAAAAYNGGRGRVLRSIRHSGSRDFWVLARRGYFRPETRDYVPKFIAAALIAKQPEKYGFAVATAPYLGYDIGRVPDATSLDVIAEAAGVNVAEVNALNPQLIRGVTPPGESYFVRLPPRTGTTFASNYAKIPAEARLRSIQHTVRRGDTLSRLAKVYGSDIAAIRSANQGVHPRRLKVGQRLFIPANPGFARLTSISP